MVLFNLMGCHKVDNQQRAFSIGNLPPAVRVFVLVWPNSFFVVMYSLVPLKNRGRDQASYFSVVPSLDWTRGVDAWLSSPRRRASSGVGGDSSDGDDNQVGG